MNLTVTGARLELGGVLKRHPSRSQCDSVHINLSGQQANTLLHDGHAWSDFPRRMLSATRRSLRAAGATNAGMFVHASFAFVGAVERGASPGEPLQSCVDAILKCEALVLAGPLPACVVRPRCLRLPEWKTRARLTTPPMVTSFRSSGSWTHSRTASAGEGRCTCHCVRACSLGPSFARSTCSRPRWRCRLGRRPHACRDGGRGSPTTAVASIKSSRRGMTNSLPTWRRRFTRRARSPSSISAQQSRHVRGRQLRRAAR